MIHPLDLATNTTMGKSKELSIDLKEHIIDLNKSGKSHAANKRRLSIVYKGAGRVKFGGNNADLCVHPYSSFRFSYGTWF